MEFIYWTIYLLVSTEFCFLPPSCPSLRQVFKFFSPSPATVFYVGAFSDETTYIEFSTADPCHHEISGLLELGFALTQLNIVVWFQVAAFAYATRVATIPNSSCISIALLSSTKIYTIGFCCGFYSY